MSIGIRRDSIYHTHIGQNSQFAKTYQVNVLLLTYIIPLPYFYTV
jgi:hypothetical protein